MHKELKFIYAVRNSSLAREEIVLFTILEKYLMAIELQKERISRSKKFLESYMKKLSEQAMEFSKIHTIKTKMDKYRNYLFIDIHFFLIAVANTGKVLTKLKKIRSYDANFVSICKKYKSIIKKLDNFRDHLEHIVDACMKKTDRKGKPLKRPGDLGNIVGKYYTLGGESFNLEEALLFVKKIFNDFRKWEGDAISYP